MIDTSASLGILQGLASGVSIGNMIRQQALQQEAAQREQMRFEHERQLNDMDTRMKLAQYTRPVSGGMVTQDLTADLPEFDPSNPGTPKLVKRNTTLVRPVDKARRVSYKTADGDTIEGELLTPEEQQNRAYQQKLEEARLMQQLHLSGALDALRAGVGPDAQAKAGRDAAGARQEAGFRQAEKMQKGQQDFQRGQTGELRTWQERLEGIRFKNQKELATLHENASTARNNADNAAADRRTDRLTAVDQERQARALDTEARGLQTDVDRIQKRKTDLEAARQKWGDLAKRIGQEKGKYHTEWRKHLADAEAKFSQADEEWKGLTKQQEALISRKNDLYARKKGMQGSMSAEDLFASYGK